MLKSGVAFCPIVEMINCLVIEICLVFTSLDSCSSVPRIGLSLGMSSSVAQTDVKRRRKTKGSYWNGDILFFKEIEMETLESSFQLQIYGEKTKLGWKSIWYWWEEGGVLSVRVKGKLDSSQGGG